MNRTQKRQRNPKQAPEQKSQTKLNLKLLCLHVLSWKKNKKKLMKEQGRARYDKKILSLEEMLRQSSEVVATTRELQEKAGLDDYVIESKLGNLSICYSSTRHN